MYIIAHICIKVNNREVESEAVRFLGMNFDGCVYPIIGIGVLNRI